MSKKSLPITLTENLSIPLIAAPMFLVSGTDLVTACCKEGVIGSFPFANARPINELEKWIQTITHSLAQERNAHPDKKIAPWAANMIVHSSYDRFDEEMKLVKQYKPSIVITALGSPARVVETVHEYGGLVFADVNSVSFAKKAAKTGIDGLVLVASGAGGHTGQISPFAFIEEVRAFWDGYVVLAGSLSSGKAIRAAEILGANLAYVGTRFIATSESMATNDYKTMLIESEHKDLILTDKITGVPAHFLKNSMAQAGIIQESDSNDAMPKPSFKDMSKDETKKAWRDIWSAGHGVGSIQSIQTAKALIDELKTDYENAVAK